MCKALAVVAIGVFLAIVESAAAQSTPRIDQRQENQDKRIDKGVASGQLNQKEATRLEKGQVHVQKMEERALKDGKLTKQEKSRIEHAQDQQNKKIKRERRDNQKDKAK